MLLIVCKDTQIFWKKNSRDGARPVSTECRINILFFIVEKKFHRNFFSLP